MAVARSTGSNYYQLQAGVEDLEIPEAVTVVGIGGHGSWTALFSALSGVRELLLCDRGEVEEIDLGRTPFRPADVGRNKAEAMAELIQVLRPDAEVVTNQSSLEPGVKDVFIGAVLFNGTDDKALAAWLPKVAEERGMRYVHGFYRGNTVGVVDHHVEGLDYLPGRQIPVWTASAAMSGCLAVFSAFIAPLNVVGDPSQLAMSERGLRSALRDDMGA